eukprot:TRINITY_DN7019_c0_g1_i1.p2 TRINITY_DN7019_c0_g1~~TRINITY_DN7019_c0_g1_i1.p2  ORF type:complete len:108 (-),score=18.77 TRINITY_DN7019_c0_g1_i1:447-770(-)
MSEVSGSSSSSSGSQNIPSSDASQQTSEKEAAKAAGLKEPASAFGKVADLRKPIFFFALSLLSKIPVLIHSALTMGHFRFCRRVSRTRLFVHQKQGFTTKFGSPVRL